jgi:hypothetical protein
VVARDPDPLVEGAVPSKSGTAPALSQDDFNLWTLTTVKGNGAVSWGVAINSDPLAEDWAIDQLTACDAHLQVHQSPGAPNWARAETPFPDAYNGAFYSHTLVEGIDFWDPETNAVTLSLADSGEGAPSWLSVAEDALNPGTWLLTGEPMETSPTHYEFRLLAEDASGATERWVKLTVHTDLYPFNGIAQVFAAEDTNYGIDNVAILYTPVLTAPDGLATFQIAADVTPMPGKGSLVDTRAVKQRIGAGG